MAAEPNISRATQPSMSPSPTAEQLAEAIHSPVASVAARAREGLADLGPAAIPVLEGVLHEPSSRARWEATHALGDMHAPAAAPALVHELTDPDGGVRWLAAEGLAALGPIALEPLCKALLQHSESAWLREGAHHVLVSLL
ncbi:MAG: HEAT repeat domain-containing protein, partial [Hyphomicrobiales bacterium]